MQANKQRRQLAEIIQGRTAAEEGRGNESISQIRDSLNNYVMLGTKLAVAFHFTALAQAISKIGRIDEGLNCLDEALLKLQESDERWCEADIYRSKADLLYTAGLPNGSIQRT